MTYGPRLKKCLEGKAVSEWSMEELQDWDKKICTLGESLGLDWYPIEYEICDYKEMIGHMAYTGLPTHYRHWSYGKSFDRIQTEYNLGMSGFPVTIAGPNAMSHCKYMCWHWVFCHQIRYTRIRVYYHLVR